MSYDRWPSDVLRKGEFPPAVSTLFDRLSQTVLSRSDREPLALELLIGDYFRVRNDPKGRRPVSQSEIQAIVYDTPVEQNTVAKMIGSLRGHLNDYINLHRDAPIKMFLPVPNQLIIEGLSPMVPNDERLLARLTASGSDGSGIIHAYHLTLRGKTNPTPMWSYKVAKFHSGLPGGPVFSEVIAKDWGDLKPTKYLVEASAPLGSDRISFSIRPAHGSSLEVAREVYPTVGYVPFPWAGIEIIYQDYRSSPVSSICILDQKLILKDKTAGAIVEKDGDAILAEAQMKILEETWLEAAGVQRITLLPPRLFS